MRVGKESRESRGRKRPEGSSPVFMHLSFPPFPSLSLPFLLFASSSFPSFSSSLPSPNLFFFFSLLFSSLHPPFSPLISFSSSLLSYFSTFSLAFLLLFSSSPPSSSPCDSWVVPFFTLNLSSSSIRLFPPILVRAIEVDESNLDYL